MSDEREKIEEASSGGWRSQPLWLKIVFLASVTAIVTGVVRCSFETTEPSQGITSVGVVRFTADLPDDAVGAPADSVARFATTTFARALRSASTAEVEIIALGDAHVDAIVALHVGHARGQLSVVGEATDATSGEVLSSIDGSGPARMIHGMMSVAADKVAHDLGIAKDEGRPSDRPEAPEAQ